MTAADFTTVQDTHAPAKRGFRGEAVFFLVAALLLVIAVVNTLAFGLVGLAMTALALHIKVAVFKGGILKIVVRKVFSFKNEIGF